MNIFDHKAVEIALLDTHQKYKNEMRAIKKAFAAMHNTPQWQSLSRAMKKIAAIKLYEQIEMLGGGKV